MLTFVRSVVSLDIVNHLTHGAVLLLHSQMGAFRQSSGTILSPDEARLPSPLLGLSHQSSVHLRGQRFPERLTCPGKMGGRDQSLGQHLCSQVDSCLYI